MRNLFSFIRRDYFFGTDTQRERAAVHQARFNSLSEARIWYSRDADEATLPGGGFQNEIVLSHEFFKEIMSHPIPTDMEAAKALSFSPAALDLFMWLSYRCFVAKGRERVPLFGDFGLVNQLGSSEYARPRKFRERLEGWLDLVRASSALLVPLTRMSVCFNSRRSGSQEKTDAGGARFTGTTNSLSPLPEIGITKQMFKACARADSPLRIQDSFEMPQKAPDLHDSR
jgi:hypothetical protein